MPNPPTNPDADRLPSGRVQWLWTDAETLLIELDGCRYGPFTAVRTPSQYRVNYAGRLVGFWSDWPEDSPLRWAWNQQRHAAQLPRDVRMAVENFYGPYLLALREGSDSDTAVAWAATRIKQLEAIGQAAIDSAAASN